MFATSGRARLAYDRTGVEGGADVLLIHAAETPPEIAVPTPILVGEDIVAIDEPAAAIIPGAR